MPLTTRSSRIYTISLLVLAFFLLVGAAELLLLGHSPGMDNPTARWVLYLVGFIEILLVVAVAVTLALRAWAPVAGQYATTALNIVLLFAFPFGTAIGIYGLWKVDRLPSPNAA